MKQKITKKEIYKYLPKNIFNVEIGEDYIVLFWNYSKISFDKAVKLIKRFCKAHNYTEIDSHTNGYTDIKYGYTNIMKCCNLVKKENENYYVISNKTSSLSYSDIFVSVRQRVNAFKYYKEYWKDDLKTMELDDILDDAYRFLNQHVDPNFIIFCAKKENEDPILYINSLLND